MAEINEEEIDKVVDSVVLSVSVEQSDAIAATILAYYKAGSDDVRKSKWTKQQQAAVDSLTAEHFGYMAQFDKAVGEQIKDRAREILKKRGGYEEVSKELISYVDDIFSGTEQVIIDNRGKMRTVLMVSEDLKIYTKQVETTHVFTTNTKAYADMVSRTAIHKAWEQGRADQYKKMGFTHFRYSSVCDERSRASHCALSGQVFRYGTVQADLAMRLLEEPNCRCRIIPFFDNEKIDTPASVFEKFKERKGVYWNGDDWAFNTEA